MEAATHGGAAAFARATEEYWPSQTPRGHRTGPGHQGTGRLMPHASSLIPPSSLRGPLERVPPPTGMEPVLMLSGPLASIPPPRKEGLPSSPADPGVPLMPHTSSLIPGGGGRAKGKGVGSEGKQHPIRIEARPGPAHRRTPRRGGRRAGGLTTVKPSLLPPPSSRGMGQPGGKARKSGRVRK